LTAGLPQICWKITPTELAGRFSPKLAAIFTQLSGALSQILSRAR
jgi:hypothetical protein